MFTGKICLGLLFLNSESVTYKGVIISDKSANAIKLISWHTKLFSYNAILLIMSALVEIILYLQKWRWNRHMVLYSNFKHKSKRRETLLKNIFLDMHSSLLYNAYVPLVSFHELFSSLSVAITDWWRFLRLLKLEWNLRVPTWCWRVQIKSSFTSKKQIYSLSINEHKTVTE